MTEHDRLKFEVIDLGWDDVARSSTVGYIYYCPTCNMEVNLQGSKRRIYKHLKKCRTIPYITGMYTDLLKSIDMKGRITFRRCR